MGKIDYLNPEIQSTIRVIETLYGITYEEIIIPNRQRDRVDARKILAVLLRNVYKLTFSKIGAILHRDHASILHYYRDHNNLVETDPDYKHFYNTALSAVGHIDKLEDVLEDVTFIEGLLSRVEVLEYEKKIWDKQKKELHQILIKV